MSHRLSKEFFTKESWDEVQTFACGTEIYETEVSDWLKRPLGEDGALSAIQNAEKPTKVWLYRLEDETLVGFGALAKSSWRWKGKNDPYIPIMMIIWCGVGKEFQGRPEGPREGRYAFQILDDLLGEASVDQNAYPVLGLCVHRDNKKAIKLYKNFGFDVDLEPFKDKENGREYRKMAHILDGEALLRLKEESRARKST